MSDWSVWMGLPLWVWLFVLPTVLVLFCALKPKAAQNLLSPLWSLLDRLYLLSGAVSAVFLVLILVIMI